MRALFMVITDQDSPAGLPSIPPRFTYWQFSKRSMKMLEDGEKSVSIMRQKFYDLFVSRDPDDIRLRCFISLMLYDIAANRADKVLQVFQLSKTCFFLCTQSWEHDFEHGLLEQAAKHLMCLPMA